MRSTLTSGVLEPISQANLEVADPTEDIRGQKVFDRNGEEIGKVDDVFIDPAERRARFVSVKSGDFLGLGGNHYLLPVDVISVRGERVVVNATADRIAQGPQVNHELDTPRTQTGGTADTDAAPIVVKAYEFYEVKNPFWSPTYQRPNWH
jgi:sporulation protein YlmC with PRC-barrel domain